MKKTGTRDGERGIALLIVMMLLLILIPFSVELSWQVELEKRLAGNLMDSLAIENAIDGHAELVLSHLQYDAPNNTTDSYADSWNDEKLRSRTDKETNVELATWPWDEKGKINVNLLSSGSEEVRQLWRDRIIEVVKRFRRDTKWDASGVAEEVGEDLYRFASGAAARGKVPRPKMLDDRAFLCLDDLFFASKLFEKHELLVDKQEGDEIAPGLHRYLTVYGDGKVNLNTADKVVLEAMFNQDVEVAQRIIEKRDGLEPGEEAPDEDELEEGEEGGEGSTPFEDVNQVMELDGVNQAVISRNKINLAEHFDVKSNYFSYRIRGATSNTQVRELYVIERVPAQEPSQGLDGFRFLLHQERTDPILDLPEEE